MSTLVIDPLPALYTSLDDLVDSYWEELSHGHPAACPLCHGTLQPLPRRLGTAVGARCEDCGTVIE